MITILVKPLDQLVIWPHPLGGFEGISSIEQLDENLNFKTTEFNHEGTVEDAFREAVKQGIISQKGWVKLELPVLNSFEEVWPEAMRKLTSDKYTPTL